MIVVLFLFACLCAHTAKLPFKGGDFELLDVNTSFLVSFSCFFCKKFCFINLKVVSLQQFLGEEETPEPKRKV